MAEFKFDPKEIVRSDTPSSTKGFSTLLLLESHVATR